MHNAALAALGLNYVYTAFHVEPGDLAAAIQGMRTLQICGLNVTVPHKLAVMQYLDEISEEARVIGAVNTIANRDGRLYGHNTDAYGVMESLKQQGGLVTLPAKVGLLGAGGAARAVLYGLLQHDEVEEVLLYNRTIEKAEALAASLDSTGKRVRVAALAPGTMAGLAETGLVINSTSVGMHPHQDASPLGSGRAVLHDEMLVLDIVYNPPRTRLMEEALAAGGRALNGLGMLAYQAARAFEIWTGETPPVETMIKAAQERMKH
jgi:shikimate dehydrogenase